MIRGVTDSRRGLSFPESGDSGCAFADGNTTGFRQLCGQTRHPTQAAKARRAGAAGLSICSGGGSGELASVKCDAIFVSDLCTAEDVEG